MNETKKFYEEKMHEKDLPNNRGQFLNGSRYSNQDWYGNEQIFHTERTFFGEALTYLTPEQLTSNPKVIFDYTDNQIKEFFKRLEMIVPENSIDLNNMKIIIKRDYGHPDIRNQRSNVYCFEDDGNTKTEGFHYSIYWVVPLSNRNTYLDGSIVNGNAVDVIYFSMEFTERIHDSKISSRFFHLFFTGLDREKSERIDYNNDNMTINSIINHFNLFKVAKNLIAFKEDESLLKKAYESFES